MSTNTQAISEQNPTSGYYSDGSKGLFIYRGEASAYHVEFLQGCEGQTQQIRLRCRTYARESIGKYYPTAQDVYDAFTRDEIANVNIGPESISIPDALRIAAGSHLGRHQGWLHIDAYTRPVSLSALGMCTEVKDQEDSRPELLAASRDMIRPNDGEEHIVDDRYHAPKPTLARFFSGNWITHQGRHYSLDQPDGVDDLHDLWVFQRACMKTIAAGLPVMTSRGPYTLRGPAAGETKS
jgi:hypothetical protein